MKPSRSSRPLAAAVAAMMILVTWPGGTTAPARAADDGVGVAELDPRTERAIDRGLAWLADRQKKDGGWGDKYRCAMTSLSMMSFMLKGYFPERGKYGAVMEDAVDFLLNESREHGGYFGVNMYEHGLTTLALSEVWGMTSSEQVRTALKKAVDVILRSQSPRGGWRYHPRPTDQDISVTVMQIVALASAREAGIYVPDRTIDQAVKYVKSLQHPSGGFGYTSPKGPGFARTAAGVMSLMMCGERNSQAVAKGLRWLTERPDSVFKSERWYFYGHYYAIQAMYQAGDSYYQKWYPKIREALLEKQRGNGAWPGGGELNTTMAILILGVPYRYLPIYQR
jgi:squalene cyclase